ncbi:MULTISPECIES: Gp138 family membrane-puncturing spike protein [Klebsiella]|uniref:Gp138 family membrane-puncturing spike protein n=1 Tax=Klebsiella TaxID=570 RepID=UPI001EDCB8F4|nr:MULTISPECIES: Gp138 family membrane-puncturing spike protein [Klebsiella]MDM4102509.1 Gp138 family membrane-puncturing spike protein [Klebsiella oxytoca]MDM4175142.1 Gp138 family membrane-puncturing spike protein [Klebsiella oxytoca]MDM4205108.1 Gp138 family membrane-puncturing spike protein [Klebsiella oxytoca]MDM4216693.1 Gp138 family membrane-puncturing spike protein [Klebsiella oxytoca]MDM4234321.1 Gp138 family membrane-puncturing spike protein [Klebsiella oxytoca]
MPVALNAQLGSKEQADAQLAQAIMSAMRVSIPGIIQSFDPDAVTAVVQPAIKGVEHDESGAEVSVSLPLLVDVPVVFPRGGGCTLTFPVTAGDECLVIFADRCIDFWWQSGGIQEPVDGRMHDLSDAFCIVGPQSQAKKISGISTTAAQLRTDDGTAFIEVAAGGDITATTTGNATINASEIILNGNVTINGNLSQGMGDGGGTATMRGPVAVTNDVTAGGKSLMTHTHGGVEHGNDSTGEPE